MTDLNEPRSAEFLEERVRYLEESNRRFVSILEMLASSSEFQADLTRAKDGFGIYRATIRQLLRLFSFDSLGFLDCQSDGSFEILAAEPASEMEPLQALVEARMIDGTFAWAINRNQAVLVPTECGDTLILQVVATQSRVRGMFAAKLPGNSATLDAASLNALSIVLFSCAYALESNVLYGMLHDHTQNLEERVRLRTLDLEEARCQAEAASLAKSHFLANMSHEIRTPMNGVMGMTELMLQGGLTPDKEKIYLRAIKDSADSLLVIINDILDFSKIEAGKFTLEKIPFNLRNAVERCLGGLMVRAEEKGLRLECRIDASVPRCLIGDQVRLRQILTNLVGNAIKFCQRGHISVEVAQDSRPADEFDLHFRVSDTGIGISEEASRRIFKEFEQADGSTTRKFGGTGLGLAICKKLVELMEGNIWVESQPGVGSCFQFKARFLLGDEKMLPVDEENPAPCRQPRLIPLDILLAEDVEINRALVYAILEPYCHRIISVDDGRKALETFKSRRFDIVLMDIQMPEMDGLQAARAIREYEHSLGTARPVPIIAMTALAGSEDRQICLDAGMDDYITKPIKPANLIDLLKRFCEEERASGDIKPVDFSPPSKPEAATDGTGEAVAVFAQEELLARIGGKTGMLSRFIGLFCNGVTPQLEVLASAVATEDADGVRKSAHAIKGSAANISAHRIQQLSALIEKSAKEGDLSDASDRLALLREEFLAFRKAVEATGLT